MSTAAHAGSQGETDDIRPVVARGPSGDRGLWIFLGLLLVGGIALFAALAANRESVSAPRTTAVAPDPSSRISSPPPLALPRDFEDRYPPGYPRLIRRTDAYLYPPVRPAAAPAPAVPTPAIVRVPVSEPAPLTPPIDPRPSVVFDTARSAAPPTQPAALRDERGGGSQRVTAGRFANPSRTVPQGTVIPAVLETALDSTRPGAARALVQRDVYGFDGTRVLIQRGSRLYGEYGADVTQGQNRALVRWSRLIRPDGVTIELDSPASDPLGRAGIRGKVDSKFFQRFGGAILQSVLDIGVGAATRKVTDGVVVALPGSTQNISPVQSQQIQPTLKVRHGTSVSVFVARDLDFSSVEY